MFIAYNYVHIFHQYIIDTYSFILCIIVKNVLIPKKFAFSFSLIFAHRVHIFLIYSTVFVIQLVATMKNGETLVITLDYDKNIYLSPNRSTVHLTDDLETTNKHTVDVDLHNALIEARDIQWVKKRAAPGYKPKRVKWYLLLDAFMQDYRDTQSLDQGPRMTALLKKAKIKDTVAANTIAIESGMYESSAASASVKSDAIQRSKGYE